MNSLITSIFFNLPIDKISEYQVYDEAFNFSHDYGDVEINSTEYRELMKKLLTCIFKDANEILPLNNFALSDAELMRIAIGLSYTKFKMKEEWIAKINPLSRFDFHFEFMPNLKFIDYVNFFCSPIDFKISYDLTTEHCGCFSFPDNMIQIDTKMPDSSQKYAFIHELSHGFDYFYRILDNGKFGVDYMYDNIANVLATLKLKFRE